jgi:tetratricopeptide (TPR) repeat protein
VSGQVGEAFVRGAVRPDILFPAYVNGFTLADAFYLATPVLGWQSVIIGDPLMAPFAGKRLTRVQLEDEVDPITGLPGLFSRRRVAFLTPSDRNVPEKAVALVARASNLLDNDDKPSARRALAEAVAATPASSPSHLYLASWQEQADDYESAVKLYREVLERDPNNVVALNNAAFALSAHLGKPSEALPLAQRAATLAQTSAIVLDTLAWTEHLLGNNEIAAKRLEEAIRLEPRHAELRLHASVVYAALGMRGQSEAHLREALKLDPALESRPEVKTLRKPQ